MGESHITAVCGSVQVLSTKTSTNRNGRIPHHGSVWICSSPLYKNEHQPQWENPTSRQCVDLFKSSLQERAPTAMGESHITAVCGSVQVLSTKTSTNRNGRIPHHGSVWICSSPLYKNEHKPNRRIPHHGSVWICSSPLYKTNTNRIGESQITAVCGSVQVLSTKGTPTTIRESHITAVCGLSLIHI